MHKNDKASLKIFITSLIVSLNLSIIYNLNYIFWIICSLIFFLMGDIILFGLEEKYEEYDPINCSPEKFYMNSKDKKSKIDYLTQSEIDYLKHR